jgi:Predicted integral membrane protein (DUF2269)
MDAYSLIKYVHVLCAIIWVGGAFFAQLLGIRAQRSSDPMELPRTGAAIGDIGKKVFLPVSILLFIAGLILVAQRWQFTSAWVSVSIVLWLLSAVTGALYLGPTSEKVGKFFAAEGPTSIAGRAALARLFLVSRLELVSFAIVVFMMVVKPGAA